MKNFLKLTFYFYLSLFPLSQINETQNSSISVEKKLEVNFTNFFLLY